MTRLEANLELCRELEAYCRQHPSLRFHQALSGLSIIQYDDGLIDSYYEESVETLRRVRG